MLANKKTFLAEDDTTTSEAVITHIHSVATPDLPNLSGAYNLAAAHLSLKEARTL